MLGIMTLSYVKARGGSCLLILLASWKNCMLKHGVTNSIFYSFLHETNFYHAIDAMLAWYMMSTCISLCVPERGMVASRDPF